MGMPATREDDPLRFLAPLRTRLLRFPGYITTAMPAARVAEARLGRLRALCNRTTFLPTPRPC